MRYFLHCHWHSSPHTVVHGVPRVLGSEHPSTLRTASNLAVTLKAQGKYVEAETMYRETLAARQRVLGSEHPDTLGTAGNLANALCAQGKCDEAETMYRETLAVQQRVLGSEHPDTLATANNLAACVRSACGAMNSLQ